MGLKHETLAETSTIAKELNKNGQPVSVQAHSSRYKRKKRIHTFENHFGTLSSTVGMRPISKIWGLAIVLCLRILSRPWKTLKWQSIEIAIWRIGAY